MAVKSRRVPQRLGKMGVAITSTISTVTGMAIDPVKVSAVKPGRLLRQLSAKTKVTVKGIRL